MNAGCFNGETWQYVSQVETINRNGEIKRRTRDEFDIAYRSVSGLADDEWFVAATCRLDAGDKQTSMQIIKSLLARRAATQPVNEYNCGSVFRNPPDNFAAQLIESCGLKGKSIGGAMVSEKHANFIVNHRNASAVDIENLMEFIQATIYDKTTYELIREVQVIGDK